METETPSTEAVRQSSKAASAKTIRRGLVALASLATLVGVFYTVENWRGKRAWEQYKRDLQHQGAVVDWAAFIPPAVPDEQNIFKAPKMQEWFVGRKTNQWCQKSCDIRAAQAQEGKDFGANITVVPAGSSDPLPPADLVLSFPKMTADEPGPKQLKELMQSAWGRAVEAPQGFFLVGDVKPVRMAVRTQGSPGLLELQNFLTNLVPEGIVPTLGDWRVEGAGTSYRLVATRNRFYTARDYLAWSQPFEADFAIMREAFRRPFARMDGSYDDAWEIPIPNFVAMRTVAQILGARAQAYLLLKQPEEALRELTLVDELSQMLELKPSGKPITLVGAMINAGIRSVYLKVVGDGLRLGAWQEAQLVAIGEQLRPLDLVAMLAGAVEQQRVGTCQTFETITPARLAKLYHDQRPIDQLALRLAPRGWIYQNMVNYSRLVREQLSSADGTALAVKLEDRQKELERKLMRNPPYNFLCWAFVPNLYWAELRTLHYQTLINQGSIACALERYRISQKRYPETLEMLVPGYLKELPKDLIGGKPLHYKVTEDGHFLLYSVGWNKTDDGGAVVPAKTAQAELSEGDWVWGQTK